jgi:ribosomal protein L11 methyltransferase
MLIFELNGTLESLDVESLALWDAGCLGLEETAQTVKAYFGSRVELPLNGTWHEADDTDWIEKWKATLKPVTVGKFTIVPSWMTASVAPEQIGLIIDPGMAFGTGHHATTQFGIQALQTLELTGKKVLDVGAGTGLLALVAAKLGAIASGVDLDPITVPIARENAQINGLNVEFFEGILSDMMDTAPYDVLVCNLYAELHQMLAGEYWDALTDNGQLILTGILADRLPMVLEALEQEDFKNIYTEQNGEWMLCTASK